MESKQKHVIHLYQFEQQSVNEKELSRSILETLKNYFGDETPKIKIKGRPHKYWAYFEINPEAAKNLNNLKQVKIDNKTVNIGRYYYDYQIFVNKLDKQITRQQVINYFSQFGEVVDIVITGDSNHCYIKMKDDNTIDSIVLARLHKIAGKQVRTLRTFGLEEDKESDKRLFLKIEGVIDSIEQFQENGIQYFRKYGKIRERPKVQSIGNSKYKMIVIYTNPKQAAEAINQFKNSAFFISQQKKNLNLILSYFYTKQNKIFVLGLKQSLSKAQIEEAFQVFGEISEINVTKTVKNVVTAVIGFQNQNDFKMALATYTEKPKIASLFTNGKPYITIFMTNDEKKNFNESKKKQNIPQIPQNARQPVFPSGGFYNQPPFMQQPFGVNPNLRQGNQNLMPMGPPNPNILPPNMIPPNVIQGPMPNQGQMYPGGQGNRFQKPIQIPIQRNN